MAKAMTEEQQMAEQSMESARHGVERLKEGEPSRAVSEVQEETPSMTYAYLAGGSILASLVLFFAKKRDAALFVGLWPSTIFNMALFYKLLKPSSESK